MAAKENLTIQEFARMGGKARARKLTKEERSESAKQAAEARWAKAKKLVDEFTEGTKRLEKTIAKRAKQKKKSK